MEMTKIHIDEVTITVSSERALRHWLMVECPDADCVELAQLVSMAADEEYETAIAKFKAAGMRNFVVEIIETDA